MIFDYFIKNFYECYDFDLSMFGPVERSKYQTSHTHCKRNTNRIKPKSIIKDKRKREDLSRKINRK